MSDTSITPVAKRIKVSLMARWLNIALLALAIIVLFDAIQVSVFFPSGSETAYLIVGAIVSLIALLGLNLTNSLRVKYVFIVCFIALLLLGYSQTLEPPTGDSAMLTSIWAHLFFLSRPIALGFALAALVGFIIQSRHSDARLDRHSHLLSLLAGTAFLAGEIAGSYWAFIGWGKSWSWSGHFFFSALIYLLFVLVFHLPRVWFPNSSALSMGKAGVLGITCALMLGYRVL